MTSPKFVFIGAGHMASSLIGGMVQSGISGTQIGACDHNPEKLAVIQRRDGITTYADTSSAIAAADVVILAVKPQVMQPLCEEISMLTNLEHKLFISIAAGITCRHLQQWLGDYPVVRCMPNLPAQVGLGVSGLFANEHVTATQKELATQAMNAVGEAIWVENEQGINHIIAAAGSAPAYFFMFMDAMVAHCIELGFSEADARRIVIQTSLGSATLAEKQSEIPLKQMCQNVAVKGGTTAAAIEIFADADLYDTVRQAMQAAIRRSQELEDQL